MLRARRGELAFVGLCVLASACEPKSQAPPKRVLPPPVKLEPLAPLDAPRAVPIDVAPVDPGAEKFLRENLDKATIPLADGEPPKVTSLALDASARGEARALVRDGGPRVATLAEGQRATLPLPLSSGDCVTIIAHGGLGVMEVDAFLVIPGEGAFAVIAQDARTGPLAIVGGQGGCVLRLGADAPTAVVWVQARRGAGPVVVGVYRAQRP